MNPSEIKKLRTESILKELIPEALANLDDGKFEKFVCSGCRV